MDDPALPRNHCRGRDPQVTITDGTCPDCGADLSTGETSAGRE